MPLYRYRCDADHVTEHWFTTEKYKKEVTCPMCQKKAYREFGARTQATETWPLHSTAFGVPVQQVDEARQDAQTRGVKLDFDGEGRAIFTSRGHRKDVLRAYGWIDRDAGYGDPS